MDSRAAFAEVKAGLSVAAKIWLALDYQRGLDALSTHRLGTCASIGCFLQGAFLSGANFSGGAEILITLTG
jgi:hypothetical protein